jgi:hypothetical protein
MKALVESGEILEKVEKIMISVIVFPFLQGSWGKKVLVISSRRLAEKGQSERGAASQ